MWVQLNIFEIVINFCDSISIHSLIQRFCEKFLATLMALPRRGCCEGAIVEQWRGDDEAGTNIQMEFLSTRPRWTVRKGSLRGDLFPCSHLDETKRNGPFTAAGRNSLTDEPCSLARWSALSLLSGTHVSTHPPQA